jgi:hypothetical protein
LQFNAIRTLVNIVSVQRYNSVSIPYRTNSARLIGLYGRYYSSFKNWVRSSDLHWRVDWLLGANQSQPTSIKSPAPRAIGCSLNATEQQCLDREGNMRTGFSAVTLACILQVEEVSLLAAQLMPALRWFRENHCPPVPH